MRLMSEGPGDTRRILRRLADGDLGRLPKIEALGERLDRNAERLSRAVTYGSLLISGSLLALTPHFGARQAGALMTAFGLGGMIISAIGALRRAYSR